VLVVVSRECRGGMLGGVRFNHFLHCATELLSAQGYDNRKHSKGQDGRRGNNKQNQRQQKQRNQRKPHGQPGGYEERSLPGGSTELHYVPTKQESAYTKSHMEHC